MKCRLVVLVLAIGAISPRPVVTAGPASPTIEQFLMPGTPIEIVSAKKTDGREPARTTAGQ